MIWLYGLWAASLQAAPVDPSVLPSWMSGYWLSCDQGREVSETWSDPRGTVMVGGSVTLTHGRTAFEFARIVADEEGLTFVAQPGGGEPTLFRAIEVTAGRIVFSNPGHDPERVIYRREGDRLIGRIESDTPEGPVGIEWHYDKAALNARCPS
jgi:hypothetical protein